MPQSNPQQRAPHLRAAAPRHTTTLQQQASPPPPPPCLLGGGPARVPVRGMIKSYSALCGSRSLSVQQKLCITNPSHTVPCVGRSKGDIQLYSK